MRAPEGESFKATSDQADRRLDRVLRGLYGNIPLGAIMKAIRDGSVRLNGAKISPSYRFAEGDLVTTPWTSNDRTPGISSYTSCEKSLESEKIATLYRSGDLWCVDKPAGLLCQPDRAGGDSLITRAWSELRWNRNDFRPALIGRLDRNVSGVVAIALNAPTLRMLSALTRDGHIKKIYRAVVLGKTPPDGEISISLYKDERRNLVRPAGRDQPGMDALTRYRTILRSETYSLVELELVTGRPHQARVHMSSIGFPIKGDFKYGDRRSGDVTGAPLCLHAFSLIFPDAPGLPDEIRGLAVVSPMPPEFFSLAKLGNAT